MLGNAALMLLLMEQNRRRPSGGGGEDPPGWAIALMVSVLVITMGMMSVAIWRLW